jgi:hypothetical protein
MLPTTLLAMPQEQAQKRAAPAVGPAMAPSWRYPYYCWAPPGETRATLPCACVVHAPVSTASDTPIATRRGALG